MGLCFQSAIASRLRQEKTHGERSARPPIGGSIRLAWQGPECLSESRAGRVLFATPIEHWPDGVIDEHRKAEAKGNQDGRRQKSCGRQCRDAPKRHDSFDLPGAWNRHPSQNRRG